MLEEQAAVDKKLQATSIAARSMLEEQNEFLLRDLKSVEESYGTDVLTLTVACGYLDRLLTNPKSSVIWPVSRGYSSGLQKLLPDNGRRVAVSEAAIDKAAAAGLHKTSSTRSCYELRG